MFPQQASCTPLGWIGSIIVQSLLGGLASSFGFLLIMIAMNTMMKWWNKPKEEEPNRAERRWRKKIR